MNFEENFSITGGVVTFSSLSELFGYLELAHFWSCGFSDSGCFEVYMHDNYDLHLKFGKFERFLVFPEVLKKDSSSCHCFTQMILEFFPSF